MMNQTIALIGSPNTGKTTLFNWLTNSKFKTVNYPGATVEYATAHLAPHFKLNELDEVKIIDTPGIYSFSPKSEDEEVTLRVLSDKNLNATTLIVVVDATQLERTLNLVDHSFEFAKNIVVALTMTDLLKKSGIKLDKQVLENHFKIPFIEIDGLLGAGVRELILAIEKPKFSEAEVTARRNILMSDLRSSQVVILRNKSLAALALGSQKNQEHELRKTTRKIDQFVLHPLFGPLLFVFVMSFLFSSIYWMAAPGMDLIESFFGWTQSLVETLGLNPLLTDFLSNGVLASLGAVLVFVPQIFILFVGIAILEQSGFLSRAASIVDRPLSFLGMGGRSFVPLLSGFACAVPATMAARNISSKRDRMLTMFIIPLMTCSARLPVYALFLGFLFYGQSPWKAGVGLTLLYLGAIFIGGITAGALNLIFKKYKIGEGKSRFMMELPLYRTPMFKNVLHSSALKTIGYIKRAGPPIFIFAALIWAGTTFPNYNLESSTQKLESSYLGTTGKIIEPIFKPMGSDWRVGIGLLSAFAAREVFVSSLAVVFNITDTDEDTTRMTLIESMGKAVNSEGKPLFTVASVISLLVFFMIALQCTTTTAMVAKESGSWRFSIIQLISLNLLAYVLACLTFALLS